MNDNLSREKSINKIFSLIAGIPDPETGIAQPGTGIAEPGDLVFLITHYPYKTLKSELNGKDWKEAIRIRLRARWRECLGWDRDDLDEWHVAIYFGGRKRKDHKRINPYIIHATGKGVQINQISPGDFTNAGINARTRMEIARFEGMRNEQKKEIIDFSRSKVGLAFDWLVGRNARLTYAFGLPNFRHDQNKFSCQQLVIAAYAAAGIHFPHPYKSFPVFNIGRFLGHPLGHPRDRVNPRHPYLNDHHIYRDPRFALKAAIYQNPKTGETIFETKNLEKYSWRPKLKEKYLPHN